MPRIPLPDIITLFTSKLTSVPSGSDLAEIENGSLHRFVGSNALVFYNAEVAMILAVFFAMDAAQKHADCRLPELRRQRKTLGLHSTVFSESNGENTRLNNN
jgi:hypothetical protein